MALSLLLTQDLMQHLLDEVNRNNSIPFWWLSESLNPIAPQLAGCPCQLLGETRLELSLLAAPEGWLFQSSTNGGNTSYILRTVKAS